MLCVPLRGLVPLQPPFPVQAVALDELQDKMAAPPAFSAFGLAVKTTEGTGAGATLIVTLAGALVPPGPLHART